jgi:hypothetical protein
MENKYLKGLFFKLPNDKAPDFVKGQISIRREDLIAELQNLNEEWINLDLKISKEGKGYAAINTWKKDNGVVEPQSPIVEGDHGYIRQEDIHF